MAVAIVQSAKADAAVGVSIAFTLGASPTPGNILVAFTGYGEFGTNRTIASAAGTWTKVDDETQTFDSLAVWWHLVVGGDGTGWTFTVSEGSEYCSGEIYELSGTSTTTPINQHAVAKTASANTLASPSLTPSVLDCQHLTAVLTDNGDGSSATIGAGWTLDQAAGGGGRNGRCAHRDALTSDTTTAIAVTWSWSSATEALVAAVLVQPPAAGGGFQAALARRSTVTMRAGRLMP